LPAVSLYAWATPAFVAGSPFDHTWVTTYNNRRHHYPDAGAVSAAGKDYWFCWGGYHAKGATPDNPTGALGHRAGNVALARCLVQSNADSRSAPAARGTVYVYGVDGVCHQLANQVLYATRRPHLTVRKARGYAASSFLYGTYGLLHSAWAAKVASCASLVRATSPSRAAVGGRGVLKMPGLPDDFEDHAREILGRDSPELLAKLLALKTEVQSYLAQKIPGIQPPDAETLNARNQHLLNEAARLLGPERFEQVFGFPVGERINLVDPSIADRPAEE
jgi:hypothetical protein